MPKLFRIQDRFPVHRTPWVLPLLVGCLVLALTASTAVAQDTERLAEELAPEEIAAAALAARDPATRPDGWYYRLAFGASGALSHSENVVGSVDGLTIALGVLVSGGVEFISGPHEWLLNLNVEHQQTQTPVVEGFIKSIDNLELATLYLYRIESVPWLGPYVRARMQTNIFEGFTRYPDDVVTVRSRLDGTTETESIRSGEKISLTGSFEPILLHESAGVFAEPIRSRPFTLKSKLGIGGQHIFVRDGYAVTDDEDTEEFELTELQSSNAFGAELEFELLGTVADNVSWILVTNFFYPFIDSYDGDISGVDLFHVTTTLGASVGLASWLSLDYGLNFKRQPFIIDEWQISNQLLLKASYNVF